MDRAAEVGQDGAGLSQGQKQRLLIARAVYKDPQYIFFDEATNALDALPVALLGLGLVIWQLRRSR